MCANCYKMIGQVSFHTLYTLYWDTIIERYGKKFLHILKILKDAGWDEYYNTYIEILENWEDK